MCQDKAKIVPAGGSQYDYFGNDVAVYREIYITGFPGDDYMGSDSGYIYVFVRRNNGTWEEIQKLIPADGEAGDNFGSSVAISGDTTVIGALYDRSIGSGYVYTMIDGKLTEDGKIISENGEADDQFGSSVAVSGSTDLFGAPLVGEEMGGTAFIVDDLFVPC